MLLECGCGKMYRVRDGATNPPKTCPACGGILKPSGGSAPPAAPPPADPRLKDLEGKTQVLERERGAARASVELKDKELQDAQASIARLGADLEKAQIAYKDALKKKEEELAQAKASGGGAAAQAIPLLKAKDEALQQALEKVASLEQELADTRQGNSHVAEELSEVEDKYREALEKKEAEVDDLNTRLQAVEKQMVESATRAQQGGAAEAEIQRLTGKISSLEKIIQDGENRYRGVQKQLEAASASAEDTRTLADRDAKILDLEASLKNAQEESEELRKKPALPAAGANSAKFGEARYLAADMDRSLGSISTALAGLVSRVRRLSETLEEGAPGAVEADLGPPPVEPDAPPDLPVVEEPAPVEAVPQLESFEAPGEAVEALPADESLLDMGGMGKRVQEQLAEPAPSLEDAPTPPPEPAYEPEQASEPLPEPAPDAESAPEAPKKGFFGKLFGKKDKDKGKRNAF